MNTQIKVWQGDITTLAVDAIVNAANSGLLGGGGVDGAIHRAGGPAILQACRTWIAEHGSLPPGQAMATPGGKLPAKKVIHTVGPIWSGGSSNEDGLLRSCYRACLEVAEVLQLRTIAFPAISTGVYGFPRERAARLAVVEVNEWLDGHPGLIDSITFCCFDEATANLYRREVGV